jgi:ArsR family transcriptional regulator, arsenate/arsenite/antimonite-responsive transcriptional repressor
MKSYLHITKALADGSRMRTVAALLRHNELCVCQLVELLRLATPTVSRHMAVLQGAGLVESRKDGRWVHYRISAAFPGQLLQWFKEEVCTAQEIKTDEAVLKDILATPVEELCRNQSKRKTVNHRVRRSCDLNHRP